MDSFKKLSNYLAITRKIIVCEKHNNHNANFPQWLGNSFLSEKRNQKKMIESINEEIARLQLQFFSISHVGVII